MSKKITFIILAITALISSRVLFALFNDPEGPNMLVIGVTTLGVYLLSLTVFLFSSSLTKEKKMFLAILVQVLIVLGLYFLL
jgi:hypothetical protein